MNTQDLKAIVRRATPSGASSARLPRQLHRLGHAIERRASDGRIYVIAVRRGARYGVANALAAEVIARDQPVGLCSYEHTGNSRDRIVDLVLRAAAGYATHDDPERRLLPFEPRPS